VNELTSGKFSNRFSCQLEQGRQIVYFLTKIFNFGIHLKALEWKLVVHMAIRYILYVVSLVYVLLPFWFAVPRKIWQSRVGNPSIRYACAQPRYIPTYLKLSSGHYYTIFQSGIGVYNNCQLPSLHSSTTKQMPALASR
jgi:hypothetical protein